MIHLAKPITMTLRSNLFSFLFLFFISCVEKKNKDGMIEMNQNVTSRILEGRDKVLIFSCVRCNCFINSMSEAYKKDSTYLNSIYMLTDTACTKLRFRMNYISQVKVDSISDEMYNVTLLRKVNGNYISRTIETEESPQVLKIINEFFDK